MKILKVLTMNNLERKEKYIDDVWDILVFSYKNVEGGLHFESKEHLIKTTSEWQVITYGKTVTGVLIFKIKQGMKIVALGASEENREMAKKQLGEVLKKALKYSWIEVSGQVEKFINKIGCKKKIMSAINAKKILNKKVTILEDGIHYAREIMNIVKVKVVYGVANHKETKVLKYRILRIMKGIRVISNKIELLKYLVIKNQQPLVKVRN